MTDIPGDVVSATTNYADALSGTPDWLRQEHREAASQMRDDARPFDVPQAQSLSDKGADLLSGLGKTIIEAAVPGGLATRGASILGAGRAAPIIGDFIGGAAIGSETSPAEGLATGSEFAALGAANLIPNPLLKLAANVALPVGTQLLRGQDPTSTESMINTGANIAVPALLGQYARRLNRSIIPETTIQAPEAPRPLFQYRAPATAPHPFFGEPTPETPVEAAAPNGLTFMGDYPRAVEPRNLLRMADDPEPGVFASPVETTERSAPATEGMLTRANAFEFAGANPALLQYLGGGTAGALANPLIDDDPDKPMWQKMMEGTGKGLGTVALLRATPGIGEAAQRAFGRPLLRRAGESYETAPIPETAPAETARPIATADSTGMGILPSLPNPLELLRKAAAEQERDPKRLFQSPGGVIARALETQFNLGKSRDITLAQEQGKGAANLLRDRQAEPLKVLLKARNEEPAGYEAAKTFFASDRTPADEAALRSSASPLLAQAAVDYHEVKRAGQLLQREATDDAGRKALIDQTPGYQSRTFEAFENPKEWAKSVRANPALQKNVEAAIIRDNVMPGFKPWEVTQAVTDLRNGILKGTDFSAGQGNAAKISRHLFEHQKKLTDEYRAFLGEHTDPVQREVFTAHKLINSASQARTISALSEMGQRGELMIFDDAARRAEYAKASAAGDGRRVEELADLVKIPDNPAFGKLSGKLVQRAVSDALNARNEVWDGGWMKAAAGPTGWMKQAMTVYNPATHGRQWAQTPMTAAIARVAPWDFWRASRELKNNPALEEELLRNHIRGADVSSQDIRRGALEMDAAFNPDAKDRALSKVKAAHRWLQKIYGVPDNLVREAAYIKRRPRYLAEGNAKGLKGEELQRYIENETTKWVNDHTMNYGTTPNAVKIARNTPFVSPFVSYQSELLRLLKTLGSEAISGSGEDRAWALGNIGALIAAPLAVTAVAKGRLSEKDRAEWERAQRLSPSYSKGQIRVPISRDSKGVFSYINLANYVPAGDLSALARNMANGDASGIVANNPYFGWEKSPVLNLIAEQINGRDSVTDQKLDGPGRVAAVAKYAIPPWIPPNYQGQRILNAITPNDEGGLGLSNSRTGRIDTPATALLSTGGLSISYVQPKQLLRRAESDLREEQGQAKSELKLILNTNASPAAKDEAKRKFILKQREAQERYRDLIR